MGIDVEPLDSRIGPDTVAHVAAIDEREWLAGEPRSMTLIVFSAKESFYKAWFPLTGVWLDFRDVVVSLAGGTGTFAVSVPNVAEAHSPERWRHARGRFAVQSGRVHTAYVVRPVA
ncbi:4'-phosphopantetheinyl transferase superfamily protein [Kribbella sp. NPDC050820]|uniref:4'-phosphopantetheinyl transferase superfamily protein n=1 Tax=Kribbella sp. NPDC050820 TaxID=3155408 RepID=UPI0033F82459